jgi:hypothetical protein
VTAPFVHAVVIREFGADLWPTSLNETNAILVRQRLRACSCPLWSIFVCFVVNIYH